jgi:hypothetical protein
MFNARLKVIALLLLALAAPAPAEVVLADGRLALDGFVLTTTHWWQTEQAGMGALEFSFEPVAGELGFVGRFGEVASMRASAWASSRWGIGLNDLYVRLAWPSGWSVTAGQFIPPLSHDVLVSDVDYPLAFTRAMHSFDIKPAGWYDVGIAGAYRQGMWDAAAAVVNGNGAGSWNGSLVNQKDMCGRLLIQPWCSWPWLGGRIYRTVLLDGTGWLTLGGEAVWETGPLRLAAEFQNHISNGGLNHYNAGYVQARYLIGSVEPGLRLEVKQPYGKRPEPKVTAGAEWQTAGGRLRLGGHYSYQNNLEDRWLRGAVLFRLQAQF